MWPHSGAPLKASCVSCTHLCALNGFLFQAHALASVCVLFLHCLRTLFVFPSIHIYFYSSPGGLFLSFLSQLQLGLFSLCCCLLLSTNPALSFLSAFKKNFAFCVYLSHSCISMNLYVFRQAKRTRSLNVSKAQENRKLKLASTETVSHVCRIIRNLLKKCEVLREARLVCVAFREVSAQWDVPIRSGLTYPSDKGNWPASTLWVKYRDKFVLHQQRRIKGSGQSFQFYHSTSAQIIYSPEN